MEMIEKFAVYSKLLLNIVEKSLLALRKVVWQQFAGEAGHSCILRCQVSSRNYTPNIIKIGCFFTESLKINIKMRMFLETSYICNP